MHFFLPTAVWTFYFTLLRLVHSFISFHFFTFTPHRFHHYSFFFVCFFLNQSMRKKKRNPPRAIVQSFFQCRWSVFFLLRSTAVQMVFFESRIYFVRFHLAGRLHARPSVFYGPEENASRCSTVCRIAPFGCRRHKLRHGGGLFSFFVVVFLINQITLS